MFTNNVFPFFPEFAAAIVTIAAAVVAFNIAAKLAIIFRRGFIAIGIGMVFLFIAAIASSLTYISFINTNTAEVVFDIAIIFAPLFVLKGAALIYKEIVGYPAK